MNNAGERTDDSKAFTNAWNAACTSTAAILLSPSIHSPRPDPKPLSEKKKNKMATPPYITLAAAFLLCIAVAAGIPTTLDGPFTPVTVPLDDAAFRGNAIDLPDTDPRVRRRATGFQPEQISVSLSSSPDSVWISWITGESQIGDEIQPWDPASVASVVRYGRLRHPLSHGATRTMPPLQAPTAIRKELLLLATWVLHTTQLPLLII